MDLATMRTRFQEFTANDAGLSDAEIDVLLNEQYSFAIPDEIPGGISEDEWTETTVAGTQDYAYPDYVHSVQRGASLDDNPIKMYFRAKEIWAQYDQSSTTQDKPYAMLIGAGVMKLYPVPDAAYTVINRIRAYPNDGTNVSELVTAGIPNASHAMAIVTGAAAAHLGANGEDQQAGDAMGWHQKYMSRLRTRSTAPPKGRRARMSF